MILKVVIIEDEPLAIKRLKRLLSELSDSFEVISELNSVKQATDWFSSNSSSAYDLIFSDIQLLDGIAFEIFEQTEPQKPVIFITAFDEYLMKAFKSYGIDYILKPFALHDLENAVRKYKQIFQNSALSMPPNIYAQIIQNLHQQASFPTFLTYFKEKIRLIKSEDIAYFSLDYQSVFAHDDRNRWLLNESLNQIQDKLPARHFFRANRQFIIHKKYLKEIENYFGGRLKLILTVDHPEILISKDNAKSFKDWLQE